MAEKRKSIIDEALLESEQIEKAFEANAKEVLTRTMSSEIEELVKESLKDSRIGLTEDEDEEEFAGLDAGDELDLGDLDLDDEDEMEDELDLDLDDEDDVYVDDLTGSDDETIINVFKKMSPEDEIEVVQDGGNIEIKDNATGAEYKIELGGMDNTENEMDVEDFDLDDESEEEESEEEMEEMEEGVIYEIILDDESEEEESEEEEKEEVEESSVHTKVNLRRNNLKPSNLKNESISPSTKRVISENRELKNKVKMYLKESDTISLSKRVIHRQITPENVDKYLMGTKIPKNQVLNMLDGGHSVSMFSNSKSTTGPQGRHKKVFVFSKDGETCYYKETDELIWCERNEGFQGSQGKFEGMAHNYINENRELKNQVSNVQSENEQLKEDYNKMVDALKQFRDKLNEVAVFNSNLTYAVRLFTENTTTKDEKMEIIKRFDDVKTLKESKTTYKQLVKEISKKEPIKESIEDKFNTTKTSGSSTLINESKVYVNPELEKMKKLWDYNYKK